MVVKKLLKNGIGLFQHRLLSGRCLGCLAPAQQDLPLCEDCQKSLALNHHACQQCALPLPLGLPLSPPSPALTSSVMNHPDAWHKGQAFSENTSFISPTTINTSTIKASATLTCASCQQDQPPYIKTLSPYLYAYPLDRFVNRFKQDRQLIYGRLLARLMADYLAQHYQTQPHTLPDQIIAVPSHKKLSFNRGFNPAALLADEVSKTLKRPFNPKLCKKVVATSPQHTLDRQARLKNLSGSFALTGSVEQQTIAVVDDVMTTGATAGVIAQLLRDNGAQAVYIWTLARTPYHSTDAKNK